MENTIYYREIKASDYQALEKIICETWEYERFCSPKVAKKMAKLYLASCLANQTFTCVAINNQETVGVIMGKDNRHYHLPLRYALLQLVAIVQLLISKEGRKIAKMFGGLEKIDKAMLVQSGIAFDGELAFFVVRKDQRGTGIGKQLFVEFYNYKKKKQWLHFYLYTDSKCNFGFYEHHGLTRIKEVTYSLKPQFNEEIQMFLYANTKIIEKEG